MNQFIHTLGILALLAIALVAGLIFTAWGLIGIWLAPVTRRAIRAWRQRWGASPSVSDETIREALRVLVRLRAWSALFAGLAVLVALALYVGLTVVLAGPDALFSLSPALWDVGWFTALFLGVGAGQLFAAMRLRVCTRGLPRHASLRPRRLVLYLPAWTERITLGLVAITFTITVLALPFLRTPLSMLFSVDSAPAPLGLAFAFVLPVAFLGVVVLQMIGARVLVNLPDLGGTLPPAEARLVDFTYRLDSINGFANQAMSLFVVLPTYQWYLLLSNVVFAQSRGPLIGFLGAVPALFVLPAMIVLAVMRQTYYERAHARFYEYESDISGGHAA